jgi:inositol phosphorylceramide mannosyltransferase catalytic subunit
VLEAYGRISACYGAARADFFRYLLLYQAGGVYLDMKSTAHTPLDEILRPDDQFLLAQWNTGVGIHPELDGFMEGSEYQQWHVIAAAGHPFLAAVIERVLRNIRDYDSELDGVGALGVLRVTGPIAYSRAIHPIRADHSHRQIDPDAAGLVYMGTTRPERAAHYSVFRTPVVS